jgi:hypothetical protein
VYSEALWRAYFALLIAILLVLSIRKDGLGGPWRCVLSILLLVSLLVATIFSPFPELRWGGLIGYLVVAVLFAMNLHRLRAALYLERAFAVSNVVSILLGIAVLVGVEPIRNFFVTYYSAFYPELLEFMTTQGKPVLSFGTHSLAAFFFYLWFWLCFETYKVRHNRWYLGFAVSYIFLGYALRSVSGLILMSAATVQLLAYGARKRPQLMKAAVVVTCLAVVAVIHTFAQEIEELASVGVKVVSILMSPGNGLSGRFSQTGTLFSTVAYLRERPFSPVGVGYRSDLFFGDSGLVEYYLRGSVLLVAAVYSGLYAFLRQNLISKADASHLFIVIVFFELGLTALVNVRVLYVLPVIVVYLNDLRRSQAIANYERGCELA